MKQIHHITNLQIIRHLIILQIILHFILLPATGGPIRDAKPWKSNKSPKAFVRQFKPNKSTRITEVRPTYAPAVKP